MQEYTNLVDTRTYIVLASTRLGAVCRALCYGSDAVEFMEEIF